MESKVAGRQQEGEEGQEQVEGEVTGRQQVEGEVAEQQQV